MKKKILFVTEFYLPGCLEPTLTELIRGLDPERCEVHLLLKSTPERAALLRRALPATVIFHEPRLFAVQTWQDSLAESRLPSPLRLAGRLALRILRDADFLVDVFLLRRSIAAIEPDFLEVVNGGYPGGMVCLAACVAGRSLGVPSIGLYALRDPQRRRFGDRLLDRLIAGAADRIMSSSRMSSESFAELRAMPREKLRTVHTGLAAEASAPARSWRSSPDDVVAGFSSYFNESKGHRFLLEAAAALAPRFPRLKWVCVGDGPSFPETKAKAKEMGLEGRVLFPGALSEAEAVAGFDLMVHPSLQENFPTVILEGMRAGKPIVAARVGGVPEQLEDGVSGVLVPPGDSAALTQAVARLLEDPAEAARLGAAARARFLAQFTVERMRRDFFAPALLGA